MPIEAVLAKLPEHLREAFCSHVDWCGKQLPLSIPYAACLNDTVGEQFFYLYCRMKGLLPDETYGRTVAKL